MKRQPNWVLVVDVGNTNAAFGLYRNGRTIRHTRLPTSGQNHLSLARQLSALTRGRTLRGIAYASVVPAVDRLWRAELRRLFPDIPFLRIHHRLKTGFPFRRARPETLGVDRIANACEAAARFGTPVIAVDIGTAATFDLVSRRGFEGGVIAPGPQLMLDVLAKRTAKLPAVRMEGAVRGPGQSTAEAMRLSVQWGYPGLVRGILDGLQATVRERSLTVCATGGAARPNLFPIELGVKIVPDLTLCGVGRLFDMNVREGAGTGGKRTS